MNKLQQAREAIQNGASRVASGAMIAAAGIGSAMAQSTGDFDPSTVTTKITTYVGYGVLILGALAVGVWTLRVMGLVGGRK